MVNSRSPSLRRHRRRGSRRRSASRIVYEPELLEDDEYYYSVYPYYEYPWIWPDEDYSIWYYNDDDNDVYEDRRRRPKYHLDDIIDDEREDDDGDPALNPWYPQDGPSLPIYTHDEDERPPRRRKSLTRKERRIPTPHHHLGAQTTSAAADDWPSDQPLCVEEAAAIPRLERRRTIHVPPLSTVQDQPPLRRRHSVFEQPTGATVSPMIPMSQAQPMTPLSPWSHQQMLLPPPPQQQFSRMPTIPPSVLSQRPQPPSMPMMQPQLPPPAPMMPMLRPQLPMQFQPNIIGPLPPLPPVPPTLPFLQAHHHPLDAPFPPPPVGMPPPPLAPPLPPLAPAAVPPPTTVPISASAQAPAQASHPAPEPKETAEAAAAGAGAIVGAATTAATASREMKDSQDSGKKEQKEAEEAEGQQEKKEQQETAENDKINAAKEQEQEQPAENASSIKETSSAPDVQERGSSPPKADAPLRRSRSLFGGLFGGSGGRGGGSSSKPKPVILNKSMWQPTAVVPMEEILQSNHKPRTVARQRNLLFPAGHPLNNRLQQLPESKDASSSTPGTTRLSRKESMRLAQKAKRLSGRSHIWCYRPLEETGEQIVWAAFDAPNQARLDPFLPAVVHKQPIRATPYTSVFLEREPELPGSTVVAPLAGRGYHFKNTFTSHKPILLEVACLPSSDKLMVRSAESFDPAPPLSFATSNNNSIADKLWNAFF